MQQCTQSPNVTGYRYLVTLGRKHAVNAFLQNNISERHSLMPHIDFKRGVTTPSDYGFNTLRIKF